MVPWEPYPRRYTFKVPCKTIKVKVKKPKNIQRTVKITSSDYIKPSKKAKSMLSYFFISWQPYTRTNIYGFAYG